MIIRNPDCQTKTRTAHIGFGIILLTGVFFFNMACKKDNADNSIVKKQGLSIPSSPSPENNSVGQNTNVLQWNKCTDSLAQAAKSNLTIGSISSMFQSLISQSSRDFLISSFVFKYNASIQNNN